MRPLAAALVLATTLAPRAASANQCNANLGFTTHLQVPLGCPIVVYQLAGDGTAPRLTVTRTTVVDVTGTVTPLGTRAVPVLVDEPGADCDPVYRTEDWTYQGYSIEVVGAQVGELVASRSPAAVEIVAAGVCPEVTFSPAFELQCSATYQEYQACYDGQGSGSGSGSGSADDPDAAHDGGCATSGGSSAGAVLAIALVAGRRRRRR